MIETVVKNGSVQDLIYKGLPGRKHVYMARGVSYEAGRLVWDRFSDESLVRFVERFVETKVSVDLETVGVLARRG